MIEKQKSADDIGPMLYRLLGSFWNRAMGALTSIEFMPIFKRWPWLFAVVIFFTMAAFIPLGLLFIGMASVALDKGVKAEDNFIISFDDECGAAPDPEGEREEIMNEAFLRAVENGHSPEMAEKASEAIGALYDKQNEKDQHQ